MDKRTLLAVILSVIVMSGGYLIQNKLAPPIPVVESEMQTDEESSLVEDTSIKTDIKTISVSDIIAVDEDPTKNIKTLENIVFVMKDGIVYKN